MLSVVICTYNPRPEILRRTLAALRSQTLPLDQWELLIVDNGSKPPVSQNHNLDWHPRARHVVEPNVGVSHARVRAIAEFRGDWLVFVDDDNLLAPDYLAQVVAIAAGNPRLAVFGAGKLQPEFEVPPPPELKGYMALLALRDEPVARHSSDPRDFRSMPVGAGACLRRDNAEQFVRLVDLLKDNGVTLGRKGGELFSHEDDLYSWAAAWRGMQFGVFPELRITHLIAASRLSREYFLRLIYCHSFSHWVTQYMLAGKAPGHFRLLQRLRFLPHALRNGVFSAQCQRRSAEGEAQAARFIAEHKLVPLKLNFGAAMPAEVAER